MVRTRTALGWSYAHGHTREPNTFSIITRGLLRQSRPDSSLGLSCIQYNVFNCLLKVSPLRFEEESPACPATASATGRGCMHDVRVADDNRFSWGWARDTISTWCPAEYVTARPLSSAIGTHRQQSNPDYGLGLSQFWCKSLEIYSSCSHSLKSGNLKPGKPGRFWTYARRRKKCSSCPRNSRIGPRPPGWYPPPPPIPSQS